MDELRNELGFADQAYQAAVDDFDAAAARVLGINRTDLRCLELLLTEGELLPSQLGPRLGLTTGSVTAMLDRLARLDYLTRSPDAADRRKVVVRITARARQLVWNRIYGPLVRDGLRGIAHYTDEEVALVTDYLRHNRELHERHLARVRRLRLE
jgi:DNA-binding MarR family transcriptional regulator